MPPATSLAVVINNNKTEDVLSKEEIDWTPLNASYANFKTHTLKRTSKDRLALSISITSVIICSCASIIALSFIFLDHILFKFTGIIFLLFPIYFLFIDNKKSFFDRKTGLFWKGKKPKNTSLSHRENFCHLKEIDGIQILEEYIDKSHKGKASFYCYETNLILKNGKRINLMDHTKKEEIINDAKKLAIFLQVGIYSKISSKNKDF